MANGLFTPPKEWRPEPPPPSPEERIKKAIEAYEKEVGPYYGGEYGERVAPTPERPSAWEATGRALREPWEWLLGPPPEPTPQEWRVPGYREPSTEPMYGVYPESWGAGTEQSRIYHQLANWAYNWEQGEREPLPDIDVNLLTPEQREWFGAREALVQAFGITTLPSEVMTSVTAFERSHANKPFIDVFNIYDEEGNVSKKATPEKAIAQAEARNYGFVIVDESGRELSDAEIANLVITDPNAKLYITFAIGGGVGITAETTPLQYREVPPEAPVIWGEEARIVEARRKFENRKQGILESVTPENYREKAEQLYRVYLEQSGQAQAQGLVPYGGEWIPRTPTLTEAENEVFAQLSPEDQSRISEENIARWERRAMPVPKAKPEPAPEAVVAPVDVGALQEMLTPYGVNVIENYPYISLMTEAHLMRLPPEVIDEMARYLTEKGLNWNDYLAISREFYGGGGAPAGGRWSVPRQWS